MEEVESPRRTAAKPAAGTRKHVRRQEKRTTGRQVNTDAIKDRQVCFKKKQQNCCVHLTSLLKIFDLQQKLKEEREAKRASLDSRHQYLFSAIAAKLGTDEQAVEELVLDGVQVSQFRSSVIHFCAIVTHNPTAGCY